MRMMIAILALAPLLGCDSANAEGAADEYARERAAMVREQLQRRGVRDRYVLAAMRAVPRHEFVPADWRSSAYLDSALPIDEGQTISQPYVVGAMTELARVRRGARVLEVGTGSGYQAAVLAQMGAHVWSIEILEGLCRTAAERLRRLGYGRRVEVRCGDGYRGWPEHAPFDAILVTAAPAHIPRPLEEQLAVGGRLVIPVGREYQELLVITRTESSWTRRSVFPVAFVPMTGEVQRR